MATSPAVLVREYKSRRAYERDARRLAAEGWTVANVAEKRGGPHLLASLLLLVLLIVPGVLALLFWRKRVLVVTYTRPS
ncbi:MAG TPA: hypothetical protein VFA70_10155 [Dehalococcoidia bacterium]|nr:hypothetical protein [Dehalococcoidia bacterium]